MQKLRSVRLSVLAASLLALGVAACGNTWEGAKEDTRENVKTTGEGLEKAGENIQKRTQ
jgi:predicted small secreted protein